MAKRTKRHPSRGERNQASCIWGLISIFGFGHGRSTHRLLGNRMQATKQCVVAPSNTKRFLSGHTEKSEVVEEKKMAVAVVVKTGVKELMAEEMLDEQCSTKQSNVSDTGFEQNDLRKASRVKKNCVRKNKAYSSYSGNMEVSKFDAEICLMPGESCEPHLQKSSDILDLEMTMGELASWINQRNTMCRSRDLCTEPNSPAGQTDVVGENIVAAIKALVEQRLNDCINLVEEGKCCSKELMDAINSIEGLFLKLLHDPNSALFQHIQNLKIARPTKDQKLGSLTGSHLSEEEQTNLKEDGFGSCKQHNFFLHRRSKSLDSFSSERDEEIKISRPRSKWLPHSACNVYNAHIEKNRSQFSFTEIKRKLKNAMRKERHGISSDGMIHGSCSKQHNGNDDEDKVQVIENFGWSSPNRDHFYSEGFVNPSTIPKRSKQASKSRDKGAQVMKETCQYPNFGESNIYVEAKKHLCDMLNNGDANAESRRRQLHKSLVPSYSSKLLGIEEMTESRPDEAGDIISISHKSPSSATQIDVQNEDIQKVNSEESSSQCLKDSKKGFKLDLFGDDQILSSPALSPVHSPGAVETKDSEDAINNRVRASPISVLEPLFTDDDDSLVSTSQPVGKDIEPRRIDFEEKSCASEQGTCMKISLEDEESAFEYVEAVLLGSGLNWDEFLLRWFSLSEVLDPSLFDEVELFSSRQQHDHKLLFDCSDEVLKEVCEAHFECLTGRSSVSHNTLPVPTGMDLINEVWKRVEWHLLPPPVPHSLDQLVKTDMEKFGKHLSIRSDIELTSYDMGETIFDELLEDTVLTFINDTIIDDDSWYLDENVTVLFSPHPGRAE